LVAVEIRGASLERVVEAAQRVRKALARIEPRIEILGPAPKPISRIQGKERWHLLLRSPSRKSLREHLKRAIPTVREMKLPGVQVVVDVDPRQLL
jgi:primosomal protein N' (replication factor Y)